MDASNTDGKSPVTGHLDRNEKASLNDFHLQGKVENVENQNYKGIDTRGIPMGSNEVYERKVAIMNQALIDMGMGSFQWKIYAMTGFGWFVDNVRTFALTS